MPLNFHGVAIGRRYMGRYRLNGSVYPLLKDFGANQMIMGYFSSLFKFLATAAPCSGAVLPWRSSGFFSG